MPPPGHSGSELLSAHTLRKRLNLCAGKIRHHKPLRRILFEHGVRVMRRAIESSHKGWVQLCHREKQKQHAEIHAASGRTSVLARLSEPNPARRVWRVAREKSRKGGCREERRRLSAFLPANRPLGQGTILIHALHGPPPL